MSWTEQFFGKYYLPTHLPVLTEEKTKAEVDFTVNALKEIYGVKVPANN